LVNLGGWLLLTIIFSSLILLVQRSEKKRRLVSLGVLIFVWSIVWAYGIYRISTACGELVDAACFIVARNQNAIAWNTTNWAAAAALIFNLLFWFLIGRYNPPRSSDDIIVIGRDG
jgi:Na+/H+-dicarboxylate symporter